MTPLLEREGVSMREGCELAKGELLLGLEEPLPVDHNVIISPCLDQIIKPMSALHLIQFGSLAGDDKAIN